MVSLLDYILIRGTIRIFLSKRKFARNRICINLGQEDKFFLFYPIQGSVIRNDLGMDLIQKYNIYDFFQAYPSCPIYRLRLSPFHAYIAPTENIIHDGSSLGQSCIDIHLTVLGYFTTILAHKI